MGAKSGTNSGYIPQVIPNLTYEKDGETYSYWFWSSSVPPYYSNPAYAFNGRDGLAGHTIGGSEATACELTLHPHGTTATEPGPTPETRAGEAERIAQDINQQTSLQIPCFLEFSVDI